MSRRSVDILMLVCLGVLAVFIWVRDTTWISSSDDTLPILVALPLFYWIGSPWLLREETVPLSTTLIAVSTFLFLLGILFNITFILSIAWTLLLWTWLSARISPEQISSVKKLLILPLMAFPWIALDANQIGWWFRLSGAWVTAASLSFLGFDVKQEGTLIVVNNIHISVEAACAGLNMLQSMLIAGSVVAYLLLGRTNRYWWNLPLLVIMSWVANTIRIFVVSIAALAISPRFATGEFHVWGGWAVLILMFCFSWFLFALQQPKPNEKGVSS